MVWCRVYGYEKDCKDGGCDDCIFEGRCQNDDIYCPEMEEEDEYYE